MLFAVCIERNKPLPAKDEGYTCRLFVWSVRCPSIFTSGFRACAMFCGECGTENPDTNRFCKNLRETAETKAAAGTGCRPGIPGAGCRPVTGIPGTGRPGERGAGKKMDHRRRNHCACGPCRSGYPAAVRFHDDPGDPSRTPRSRVSDMAGPGQRTFPRIAGWQAGPRHDHERATGGGCNGIRFRERRDDCCEPARSAINGLVFTAPAGAYPAGQQVTISSAPVSAHTFGNNFNPVTPLISISAGRELCG